MYDFNLAWILFRIFMIGGAVWCILYQWYHWQKFGYFFHFRDYKDFYVDEIRRSVISYLIISVLFSTAAGFLGFIV